MRKYAYLQRYKFVHARNLKEKVDRSHDLLLMISSKISYLRLHNIIPYDVFEQIFGVTELGKKAVPTLIFKVSQDSCVSYCVIYTLETI